MNYNPSVVAKPSCAPPIHDSLLVKNFLGEYKTEVDKARVRFNLGIPDDYSFNWGNIQGLIENLADLVQFINAKTANAGSQYDTFTGLLNNLSSSLNNLKNLLEGFSPKSLKENIDGTSNKINLIWANVAQNSTDINTLYKLIAGDKTEDSAGNSLVKNLSDLIIVLTSKVNDLESKVNNIETKPSEPADLTEIKAQIAALQQAIGANQLTELTLNITSDALLDLTTEASDIDIIVTANYTKIDPVVVTDECSVIVSNQAVATWNNGKLHVVGAGLATITFNFRSKSTSLSINVLGEAGPTTNMCYIGWASNYTLILKNADYETSSLSKTWNDSNLKVFGNTYPTLLWACTPINTIISKVDQNGIVDIPEIAEVADNYNIYYLGYAKSSIAGASLTITTSNG